MWETPPADHARQISILSAREEADERIEVTKRYAATTKVPVDRTRSEIEALLKKYGADQFISGWEHGRAMLGFRAKSKMIRFELKLPQATGASRGADERVEQEVRSRWRALLLVIKAKLEAVESGIATFESEFLAHIVLPNNLTVGQVLLPQLDAAYKTGTMPRLLGDGHESPAEDPR